MAVGAMIQGSIGFGLNVVAAPILVLIDTEFVPGPALFAAFILTLLIARRDLAHVDLKGAGWVFVGRVPTSVAAALTVASLPEDALAITLACLVIVAVAMSAFGVRFKRTPPNLVGAGALSGVMGTISSVGGPPVAMMYQDTTGAALRGTVSVILATGAAISMALLAAVGRFGLHELQVSLVLLPPTVVGFFVSRWTTRYLDRGFVRPAVLGLSAASAIAAIVRYAI